MDRHIEKKHNFKKYYVTCAIVLAIIVASYVVFSDPSSVRISKDAIRFSAVKQGAFNVYVVGNGTVIPSDVEYVLPKAAGDVISVEVASGDYVEQGQTLFVFGNEELLVEYGTREIGVAEAKAALASQTFELKTQKLQLEMAVLQAESSYKVQAEEFNAQEILMKGENSPISILEYRQTEIRTQQLLKIYKLEKNRLANFDDSMASQLDQYQARLNLAENMMQRTRTRLDDLKLKANKAGVIQDVDIKPGQRVDVGMVVGVISNPDDVYVRLKVSAIQGHKLKQGQRASVEISGVEKMGKVVRIDPNVKGTTLDVDIALDDTEAKLRSNMFVSGRIVVAELPRAFYVEAPTSSIENGISSMYVLSESGDHAVLKKVQTGFLSAGNIQVESGLQVGAVVVVSDVSKFRGADNIELR